MRPNFIIVHHEYGFNGFASVNEYHRQLDFPESSLGFFCGYQYYIDLLGVITQARKDDEMGAHTVGMNDRSIGICVMGNGDIARPTAPQMIALKNLILKKMTEWAIHPNNIAGHRKFASYKSCPGRLLSDSDIRGFFQPDISYYQSLLNSLADMLRKIKLGALGGSAECVDKNTKN